MLGGIGAQEIVIILIVGLLVFGATRLPKIARSLGQGIKEFKKSVKGLNADDDEEQAKTRYVQPPYPQQSNPAQQTPPQGQYPPQGGQSQYPPQGGVANQPSGPQGQYGGGGPQGQGPAQYPPQGGQPPQGPPDQGGKQA